MNHLQKIAAALPEFGLDAMLLTSAPGEFYAVGFHGEGAVVVTKGECLYVTDARYTEAAERQVTGAAIAGTGQSKSRRAAVAEFAARAGIKTMGFEDGYMTVADHGGYSAALSCELIPAQKLVQNLRAAKDADEISVMTRAQRIAERALEEAFDYLAPGMTEREVASRLVYDMLRFGAEKTSFDPIVASGPNGSMPHAIPGERKIQRGDFVTMDFGCVLGGYCSDMTRTVAVGLPTEEMRDVYELVLQAQLAGIAAARAGVQGKAIDAAARKVIDDAGYGPQFGHGFGHGLGIEVHEAPNANAAEETVLPVGAVVSAEPGIYLPGRFGVRIEDVIVLTEAGSENLMKAPKELIIL